MLAIELFRENPKIIKDSEKKRFKDPKVVDTVIEYDNKWRATLKKVEDLKHKRNVVTQEISHLKKQGKPVKNKISEMRRVVDEINKLDVKSKNLLEKRDEFRYSIGNILDKKVPVGDESKFKLIRKWGIPKKTKVKSHYDILKDLNLADFDKAAEVTGARFYYLKNQLVILNFAMIRYAVDIMIKHGFTPIWTPFMLNYKSLKKAAQISEFADVSYKIENDDLFLISTAEQTLANLHANEVIPEEKLPITYTGYSTNFRREAGSRGKYSKGLFRVHQFEKVEQYVFCKPKDSPKWHEKLIKITEEIFKGLEIPYRVVCLASGDTNDNSSITYDLEGWFPSEKKYFELASDSNCTDYQSRKLNIRYGKMGGDKEIVHTLNNTALATERAICALVENHLQKDGSVKIPKKLQKYTGFKIIK